MSQQEILKPRQQAILKALIEDYIDQAEPVASKALALRHPLGLSAASVRNSLAELEQLGYLEQPHTSAGRVPSDAGYRVYVNSLMRPADLAEEEKADLQRRLGETFADLPELLRRASLVLSEDTGYASLVLAPRLGQSRIRQLKMLMIEPGRALLVVVLSAGLVKDRLCRIPDLLDQEQLLTIARALERRLGDSPIEEISLVTLTSALQDVALPEAFLNQLLYETYVAIKQAEQSETYMEGLPQLFRQPEFQASGQAGSLAQALAQRAYVSGILEAPVAEGERVDTVEEQPCGLVLRIGQEIASEPLRDCSFVTATYRSAETIQGSIAVVGPKRMDYARVIPRIDFVRRQLGDLLDKERLDG